MPNRSAPTLRNRWWLYLILTIGLVVVVAPFIWMLLGSVKTDVELRMSPPTFLPQEPTIDNFVEVLTGAGFGQAFLNSTIIAVVVTAGNLLFCSMVGYALAMLDFRGSKVLFGLIIGTLMVPGLVTFVPLFVLVVNAGLADSLLGLILPFLVSPFGVFLMRQFTLGLPIELVHAARVDGAGELRIFGQVILPLLGPALATLGILTFLGSWNSFLWPLVVAQRADQYTLPVVLALVSTGQNQTQYGLLLAGATVVIVPVLIVFLIFQKRIIEGIATTGIK